MNYDELSNVDAGTKVAVWWPASQTTTVCDYRGRIGNTAYVWTGVLQIGIAPEMIIEEVK